MKFLSPGAGPVFERYEIRREADARRMAALRGAERMDRRDEFLLPVGPEAGALLHALILAQRPARILELGTSYGYSTLFLADAAWAVGARVVTMDLAGHKQDFARMQLTAAGLADVVEFRRGDAVAMVKEDTGPWNFVLLDLWKELYVPCLEALYPKLAAEGIIAADNMIEPEMARPEVRAYRTALRGKADLQTTLVPVGSGIELTVRWPPGSEKL